MYILFRARLRSTTPSATISSLGTCLYLINKCFDSVLANVTFRAVTANGEDFFVATQLTSRHSYKVRFKTTSCSDRKDDYGVMEYNPKHNFLFWQIDTPLVADENKHQFEDPLDIVKVLNRSWPFADRKNNPIELQTQLVTLVN